MPDAVGRRKFAAFGATNIGNEELQFGFIEIAQSVPRLTLQRHAPGALRIMNLHDCRNPVADTRKVSFPYGRSDGVDQVPAHATAD